MAGRLAAVVPRSRSRSPQAVARANPGDMISQVRGVSGTTVASIEMHTHDQCRVLKRRISAIPQGTCVQEGTTIRVMDSFAPCGIMVDVVVIHAKTLTLRHKIIVYFFIRLILIDVCITINFLLSCYKNCSIILH